MKKNAFVELVRRALQNSDAPVSVRRKYDEREITLYSDIVYNDLVSSLYVEGMKTGDLSALDTFGKAYKRTVAFDSDREQSYIDLGFDVVPIPDSQGIRQISPYKDQSNSFDYRDNNSRSVFKLLLVDVVSDRPYFEVELPRIYLGKMPTDMTTIMAKVIPPFSELEDTDEVFIPNGKNMMLFDMVYNAVLRNNQLPESQYNNNSSKQI